MLKILPKYDSSIVYRSRDPSVLSRCAVVVDVGAKYEPDRFLFDHHQREFTGVLDGYNTKLSSAGLVYKHFGKDIIRQICTLNDELATKPPVDETLVDTLYKRLYEGFVEHVDAIDNGISLSDGTPKYHVSTTLSNRVGHLNPAWNQPQTNELYSQQFQLAMELTCTEFLCSLHGLLNIWWPARAIIHDAVVSRHSVHPSGKIAVLSQYCPWKEHLFEIETEVSR